MKKIKFQNLPDETTPINNDNLNAIQDNVENDIGLLSNLNTTNQNNIVSAINEVNSNLKANTTITTGTAKNGENIEGSVKYFIIGKICLLKIRDFRRTSETSTQGTILATGLPKINTNDNGLFELNSLNKSYAPIRVNVVNTNLILHYSTFPNTPKGSEYFGVSFYLLA